MGTADTESELHPNILKFFRQLFEDVNAKGLEDVLAILPDAKSFRYHFNKEDADPSVKLFITRWERELYACPDGNMRQIGSRRKFEMVTSPVSEQFRPRAPFNWNEQIRLGLRNSPIPVQTHALVLLYIIICTIENDICDTELLPLPHIPDLLMALEWLQDSVKKMGRTFLDGFDYVSNTDIRSFKILGASYDLLPRKEDIRNPDNEIASKKNPTPVHSPDEDANPEDNETSVAGPSFRPSGPLGALRNQIPQSLLDLLPKLHEVTFKPYTDHQGCLPVRLLVGRYSSVYPGRPNAPLWAYYKPSRISVLLMYELSDESYPTTFPTITSDLKDKRLHPALSLRGVTKDTQFKAVVKYLFLLAAETRLHGLTEPYIVSSDAFIKALESVCETIDDEVDDSDSHTPSPLALTDRGSPTKDRVTVNSRNAEADATACGVRDLDDLPSAFLRLVDIGRLARARRSPRSAVRIQGLPSVPAESHASQAESSRSMRDPSENSLGSYDGSRIAGNESPEKNAANLSARNLGLNPVNDQEQLSQASDDVRMDEDDWLTDQELSDRSSQEHLEFETPHGNEGSQLPSNTGATLFRDRQLPVPEGSQAFPTGVQPHPQSAPPVSPDRILAAILARPRPRPISRAPSTHRSASRRSPSPDRQRSARHFVGPGERTPRRESRDIESERRGAIHKRRRAGQRNHNRLVLNAHHCSFNLVSTSVNLNMGNPKSRSSSRSSSRESSVASDDSRQY